MSDTLSHLSLIHIQMCIRDSHKLPNNPSWSLNQVTVLTTFVSLVLLGIQQSFQIVPSKNIQLRVQSPDSDLQHEKNVLSMSTVDLLSPVLDQSVRHAGCEQCLCLGDAFAVGYKGKSESDHLDRVKLFFYYFTYVNFLKLINMRFTYLS